MPRLHFGLNRSCDLDLADFTSIGPADGELCGDPIAAVRRALANPLNFPQLAQATVPGDVVVVAIPDSVPLRDTMLLGIASGLCDAGVEPAHITLLTQSAIDDAEGLRRRLASMGLADVALATHDADDEKGLAMVGVLSDDRPLRLNRQLVEADLALLLTTPSLDPLVSESPRRFAGLYPQFGGAECSPNERSGEPQNDEDQAGWLLGIGFTVQAIPGPDGALAGVIAGEPGAVAEAAIACRERFWTRETPRRGDLVVAALAGDQRSQSWAHVARAVSVAETAVVGDGAVVVCSELSAPPNRALSQLCDVDDYGKVERKLRHDNSPSAQTAHILAHALARRPVYLMSRLPAATVEALGMTPVADERELQRLVRSRGHCILLHEAQELRLLPEGRAPRKNPA